MIAPYFDAVFQLAIDTVDIVYLSNQSPKSITRNLKKVNHQHILSIGDNQKLFCEVGGMVNVVDVNGKLKFEINYDLAHQAGFKFNSQLLELASIISS